MIREKIFGISAYMRSRKISFDLQYRVREYLEYYFRQQTMQSEDIEQSISCLSQDLRNSLIMEANRIVLRDSQIFSKNFSEKFIAKCVNIIQETNFPVTNSPPNPHVGPIAHPPQALGLVQNIETVIISR